MPTNAQIAEAKEIIAYYTLAAAATGSIPVPAASVAVVAESGVMLAHIASTLGAEITIADVVSSLGIVGSLNVVGRNVFIEGAKLLSWGTGSVWAMVALSALGATTAGMQTYIIGRIAIEIGKRGGGALPTSATAKVVRDAKATYSEFMDEWKRKKPKLPGTDANVQDVRPKPKVGAAKVTVKRKPTVKRVPTKRPASRTSMPSKRGGGAA